MELRLLLACDGKIEEQVLIRFSMKKEHSERSRADKAERLECWERVMGEEQAAQGSHVAGLSRPVDCGPGAAKS